MALVAALVGLDALLAVYVYMRLAPSMKRAGDAKDVSSSPVELNLPPGRRRGYSDYLHQTYIEDAKKGEEVGGDEDSGLFVAFQLPHLTLPHYLYPQANPFVNETVLIDEYERVKLSVMSVTVFPIRLLLSIVILLLAMVYTNLAAIGMSKEDGVTRPISKFRAFLLLPFRLLLRSLLFVWGFHWIVVKGKKASAKEAPVICPNHVSFIEPLWVVYANTPMSVGAYATMMFPGFSKAHKLLQNIPLEKVREAAATSCAPLTAA